MYIQIKLNSFVKSYILKQFIKPKIQKLDYDYHFYQQFCDVFKLIKSYLLIFGSARSLWTFHRLWQEGTTLAAVWGFAAVVFVAEHRLEAQAPGAADPGSVAWAQHGADELFAPWNLL